MDQVKVVYYGHSCFVLENNGYRVAVDPYRSGMIPGLPELCVTANAVFCSHSHDDHGHVQSVLLEKSNIPENFSMEKWITPHDDQGGKLRGMNTVHTYRFGNLRIAHLGDIGCFPDEGLLSALQNVDCLLIPVGGFYTIDAETAKGIVDAVNPRVCVPMHYRTDTTGLGKIAHLSDFAGYYERINTCENSFVLTQDTPKQILVIQYNP